CECRTTPRSCCSITRTLVLAVIRDKRIAIIHAAFLLFAAALIVRAARVQLWQHAVWASEAAKQQYAAASLPASRGEILDASGGPLARSRVMIKLAVRPIDVRDRRKLSIALTRLGVSPTLTRAVRDSTRAWVEIPRTFAPSDVEAIVGLRGVHATPVA